MPGVIGLPDLARGPTKRAAILVHRPVLFIDDGGVMSDNERRGSQWRRLAAQFFAPRLGGDPDAWEAANYRVISVILEPDYWHARLSASPDYDTFERAYFIDWLTGMCRLVGVPAPPEEEIPALSRQATDWIIPQVRAAYPGAPEAIRQLHERGYRLCTASGEASCDLAGYLEGMGALDCFDRLYGVDLVDTLKSGPEFYERILADAKVSPHDAIFVDDNPRAAGWASSVGAHAILVGAQHTQFEGRFLAKIGALAELPAVIERSV